MEPDKTKFTDDENYRVRKESYDKFKAVFDSNLADGTTEKVYEVCFFGKMSGEIKYAYMVPEGATGEEAKAAINTKEKISEGKQMIQRYKEQARQEIIEGYRQTLAKSEYSKLNTPLSGDENKIFHAVLMKFIPQAFKKEIGLEWENSETSFRKNTDIIEKNRNSIKREFVKSILSERSVCYSHDLAGMLGSLMENQFPDDLGEITKKAMDTCDKKTSEMEKYINTLKAKK